MVQAEKQIETADEQAQAKTELKELFAEVKNKNTPIVVERIVDEINEIVRIVRFEGWQGTTQGQREVKQALRKVLYVKYQLKDQVYSIRHMDISSNIIKSPCTGNRERWGTVLYFFRGKQ